jgi:hypothetical protein
VGSLVYSPDGLRLGYLARRGGQGMVVHEPARTALDGAVEGSLVFSRDSGHWACLVTPPGAFGLYIAIDGVPRIRFDLEELTAAVARLPYSERVLSDHTDLVRRWVAGELELYLFRAAPKARADPGKRRAVSAKGQEAATGVDFRE